ncbi:hypothetical protein PR202_gb12899 [Eleusine coracana subsp. coracana]|uniref:Reverse transcriptase RNase H-like domain-containing protein n=1 Tax=Eleusine coracana subsp. coracana TaxID=191504 RepID=A0AAV5EQM8_ELECO|nr:hypothetical protein PR202_gb12899 [Eleusine coracana subsp. coracana]
MLYSDHSPILAVLNSSSRKPRKPFRFENWWLLEPDFQSMAKSSWQKSNSSSFTNKTKNLATDLKVWRKKKKPLHQQLQEIEHKIQQGQNKPPHEQNYNRQATLAHNHNMLLTRDAEYHRQRFKKTWATQGDRNTNFFQQAILKRTRKNRITFLLHEDGTTVAAPEDIAAIFTNYFQRLFTTQLLHQDLIITNTR